MFIPATPKNGHQCHDHQRKGDKREQHVRSQEWKINCRQPTGITGRSFANVHVVNDVADEEQCGRNDRRDHARHMSLPDISPDEKPAGGDEDSADEIEGSIQGRKIVDGHETGTGEALNRQTVTSILRAFVGRFIALAV
jgi:hypothetical protein